MFRVWGCLGVFRVNANRGYIGIMEKKMEATIWGLPFRVYGFRVFAV